MLSMNYIWLKIAKRFLTALATNDHETIENLISDKLVSKYPLDIFGYPIQILDYSYRGKTVFIEYISNKKSRIGKITFDDFGKIDFFKLYE